MTEVELSNIIENLWSAWVIWVSSISSLVTIEFWKQRRQMNAAFRKIRELQYKLDEVKDGCKRDERSYQSR